MRYDPISWMCINRGNCTFHQLNQDTPEHERAAFSSYFKRTGLNPGMSQTVGTCVIYLCVCVSPSVVSDCVWPHGLKPTRLLWPWNSPGKNTGVGSHSLFQGIFSKGSLPPGNQTWVSCPGGRFFTIWATREARTYVYVCLCTLVYIECRYQQNWCSSLALEIYPYATTAQ